MRYTADGKMWVMFPVEQMIEEEWWLQERAKNRQEAGL